MIEVLFPLALGFLGGGMGYVLARKQRHWRYAALQESDRLRAKGALSKAVVILEQALQAGGRKEPAFAAEALYRLAALYAGAGNWKKGEAACQELLQPEGHPLGLSGRHDVLRHLARCLAGQGRHEEHAVVVAEADTLIEQIDDTAYRLFARQERLVRLGQFREALDLQEELLRVHADRIALPSLQVVTAFTALRAGYLQDALRYAELALTEDQRQAILRREALRVAARAAEELHEWPLLVRYQRQRLALAEALQDARQAAALRRPLAEALLQNNQLSEAREFADDDPQLGLTIARLERDTSAARQHLTALTGPPEGRALLAAALALEDGEGDTALLQLDLILPTADLPAWIAQRRRARRAWALALLERAADARAELGTLPDAFADTETELICREARAHALYHLGQRTDAITALEELLAHPALAPAFEAYHNTTLAQWTKTP